MQFYNGGYHVSRKDDNSPFTEADIVANQFITKALKAEFPNIPILTEETVPDFNETKKSDYYWLVDPLDGTKEFIECNGEFTVNIALICEGNPVMGVVFAPAKNITYRALKEKGAFIRKGNSSLERIHVAQHKSGLPYKVLISRSHSNDAMDEWLSKFGEYELIAMGSSLKICLIAEGVAHIYPRLGPTCLWDTAAAHAILKEAGGEIKTLSGETLSYANPKEILNPFFMACCET